MAPSQNRSLHAFAYPYKSRAHRSPRCSSALRLQKHENVPFCFNFRCLSRACLGNLVVFKSKIASIATNEGRFSFRRTAQEHAVVFERDGLAVPGVLALELVQPDAAGGSERASGRMTSSEKLNAAAEAKRTLVPEIKSGAKRRPGN